MGRGKINFLTCLTNINAERWNQFLVSSVLVCLHAVTKVLGQTWSPFFTRGVGRGYEGHFPRLWIGLLWRYSTMNEVFNEFVCCKRVCYKRGLLRTGLSRLLWTGLSGLLWTWSVMNMVCCERGLLWTWSVMKGLLLTWSVKNVACYERDLLWTRVMNRSIVEVVCYEQV